MERRVVGDENNIRDATFAQLGESGYEKTSVEIGERFEDGPAGIRMEQGSHFGDHRRALQAWISRQRWQ